MKKEKPFSSRNCSRVVFADTFGQEFSEQVSELFESQSFAMKCLEDPDWRKRASALEVLLKHWRIDRTLAESLCRKCALDPHVQVRSLAIGYVGDILQHTDDRVNCMWLANVALDDERSNSERRSAYNAIVRIRCRQTERSDALGFKDEMNKREQEFDEMMNDKLPQMDLCLLRKLADGWS
jgi:hypothetical protein